MRRSRLPSRKARRSSSSSSTSSAGAAAGAGAAGLTAATVPEAGTAKLLLCKTSSSIRLISAIEVPVSSAGPAIPLAPVTPEEVPALVSKIEKQNVYRAIIESYLSILEHEGRLHTDFECLICEVEINSDLSIVRGFLPVHKSCIRGKVFDYLKIKELFFTKKTINLNDDEVENLFEILLLGL